MKSGAIWTFRIVRFLDKSVFINIHQIPDLFLTEVHIFQTCKRIYLTDTLAMTWIVLKSSGLAPGILAFFI